MHMQGFSRMFRPVNYAPSETDHERVKARGKEIMEKGLELMNKALEGKDYLTGSLGGHGPANIHLCASPASPPVPDNCEGVASFSGKFDRVAIRSR